jgi:hypothetical protein
MPGLVNQKHHSADDARKRDGETTAGGAQRSTRPAGSPQYTDGDGISEYYTMAKVRVFQARPAMIDMRSM